MIWPTTKSKLKKIKKLQELGNTQAREKLVLLMNKESEVSLKNEAVKALSSIPSKKVVGPLIMALKNDSPQARATAAESLGSHREASAVEPLIQVLQDPDDVVRMRAAEALGKIGDARAVEPLCKMLEDKEWAAHWAAALALGRIGDTRAISPLLVWVEKILSAANRKMSSQEKLNAVRDVLFNIFQKADDQVLHTLAENLIMSVRITSWEITNRQTGESGWVKRTYENPIWSILKYELNERKERRKAAEEAEAAKRQAESGEAPPAGEAAPEAPAKPADEMDMMPLRQVAMPKIEGIVAEFLKFLKEKQLQSLVVVGGAARDLALGRQPADLDVTFKINVPDQFKPRSEEPIDWNMAFIEIMDRSLDKLAEALEVSIADLLAGKAQFKMGGTAVSVHYVGPYFFEEEATSYKGLHVEQRLKRHASRLALVADHESGKVLGLAGDATINRMWIDTHGHWGRNCKTAIIHLQDKQIHLDGTPEKMGLMEILRLLAARHKTEFSVSEAAYNAMVAAVEKMKANPELAQQGFSKESWERLITSADLAEIVDELQLLEVLPLIMDCLDVHMLEQVSKILAEQEGEIASTLQEAEEKFNAALKEAQKLKDVYEKKLTAFCKHVDHLDESKSTKYDIEARLAEQTEKLREIEAQALQASTRLEQATKNLRGFKTSDNPAVNVIQEHRDALAHKRERDAALEKLRKEVESLKNAVEKKYAAALSAQEEIERMGNELEKATHDYQEAQALVERLQAEYEEQKAEITMTADRRKLLLCGA